VSQRQGRELLRGTKGAVLAEFVIAIVPVLITFFSFVQLSKLATARLVVKHSTIVGARAASVISNVHNNTPDAKNDGKADITNSVRSAMGPWIAKGSIAAINVTVDDQSSRSDPYGWVTVTVRATYVCKVPMGFLACGGLTKTLEESYRMPHQGAIYEIQK
jgi:Flp pilus assembly protein TadG